ncbi:MAG: hypothetical protein R3344_01370 [Acidobacteriota bacterium]|nr:hypothetical protein [Acidobacteriota bacterium]
MIRPGVIWTIARAEGRLTRRLVRYWVFVSLSWVIGLVAFLWYGLGIHRNFSSYAASAAVLNPRYLIGIFGVWYTLVFCIGIIFLAFDIRNRDVRERIVEVLDAKPFSNIELVLGRYVGLMLLAWIPVVLNSLFLGLLSAAVNEPIQPLSLFIFSTFMSIPAMTFMVGLVFLSTVIVRNRWLGALVSLALLLTLVFSGFFIRIHSIALTDIAGGFQLGWPSDLVFLESGLDGLFQRFGFLAAGFGMMLLAAALYPRLDEGSRSRRLAIGGAVALLAVVLVGTAFQANYAPVTRAEAWLAAHEERRDDPVPDLVSMSGNVQIDPGRDLSLDLTLRITTPPGTPLDTALFSLNPGIEVERVATTDGGDLEFTHENGLLDVRLPGTLQPSDEIALHVLAQGRPLRGFAYLEQFVNPLGIPASKANIFLLGFEPFIFDDDLVALVPGASWLPAPGPEVGRGDSRTRPADLFTLELGVDLPEGWLVAGPGRRHGGDPAPDGMVSYRFSPPAPLPGVALVAGRFESRSMEIDGILFEVLVHPVHAANIDFFADVAGELEDRIAQKLEDAAALGLDYPYDGFTLVEVPNSFRTYGGGWRMGSTMGPAAMAFMKESSLPTARFDVPFGNPEEFKDREGGVARAKLERLEEFFWNDFLGGNLHTAAALNFFPYQTSGGGPEGPAFNFLFETLAARLVVDSPGYFSAHIFLADGFEFNRIVNGVVTRFFVSGGPQGLATIADAMIGAMTQRLEVWDAVLDVSLASLDPWDDPRRTIDVLMLKGDAMARSMLDGFGRQKVADLMVALRERFEGQTFYRADVIELGNELGMDLEPFLAVWVDETELPGFVLDKSEVFRLTDAEDGSPRYQILLGVRNDEAADGMLRVSYVAGETGGQGSDLQRGQSDPILVPSHSGVEIGLVTSKPPTSLSVAPYLSLNREPFAVELDSIDPEDLRDEEPFRGIRAVDTTGVTEVAIVVDDLDSGFEVHDDRERPWWRFGGGGSDETDQGLPSLVALRFGSPPDRWSRRIHPEAFGKYRHTMAAVRAGEGDCRAVFAADVPRSGPWELEFHLPWSGEQIRSLSGTWKLAIEDSSGRRDVTFNTGAATEGWNSVGNFEIAEGDVRVELSNETDASLVIADAIRWKPAGGKEVASR